MDGWKLYSKQLQELKDLEEAQRISYDHMRRKHLKTLWQMKRYEQICTIENFTAMLNEIEDWIAEWGKKGSRWVALTNKHDKEISDYMDHQNLIKAFEDSRKLRQN